jgi:hypothetical protein
MIADELNMIYCTAYQIVTQHLQMREMCAKIAHKNVYDDQNEGPHEVSAEML